MNKLSEYTEISPFSESTVLVQKGNTVYVKKRIPNELTGIYKTLAADTHKNLARIIDIFEYKDSSFIIEEYISGRPLADILSEQGTLSEAYTKHIIGQLCDGLLFLHKHGIIHRDITPNNVIITSDNIVKIIDFDISRTVRRNASSDTMLLGTAGYAAPEQFGFAQSDTRTDIYAAGVLANVMLTGRLPNETLCGGRLGRIIKKAVSIDADIRYRRISDFKHAFINETDENTFVLIRALRCIPGFRTWTGWKMLIAVINYAVYLPLMGLFIAWSAADAVSVIKTISGEMLSFAVPFVLMTNLGDIRRLLSRNRAAAFVAAVIISVISLAVGSCILLNNMANVL